MLFIYQKIEITKPNITKIVRLLKLTWLTEFTGTHVIATVETIIGNVTIWEILKIDIVPEVLVPYGPQDLVHSDSQPVRDCSSMDIVWNHLALQNTFLMLGISEQDWVFKGEKEVFMLIGLMGDLVMTFTGIRSSRETCYQTVGYQEKS